MSNVSRFPDRRVIEQEAYEWLVKLDRDEPPSKEDLDALREWLSRGPVHRQELDKLNSFWSNNILTDLVVPLGRHDARSGLLAALGRKFPSRAALAATAATGMLAMALGLWLRFDPLTTTNDLYVTAVGQQKTVHLADGSTVQLNTNSQIQVEYNNQYRNVRLLQGEVYFEVAKNTESPFRVYAGAGRIQAIGTAFIVSLNDETMNVLVTEGRVALDTLGTSQPVADAAAFPAPAEQHDTVDVDPYVHSSLYNLGIIKAAQSITLDMAESGEDSRQELVDAIEEIGTDELTRRQAWRHGLLVFAGEPLEQVVREVSRYTTVSVEIVDPELRTIQIGGRFRVGEVEEMFAALETNFDVEVSWLNYNRVQLKAK